MAQVNERPVYSFVTPVPERYKCLICHDIQQEPVLVSCCGQHFCKACLEEWFSQPRDRNNAQPLPSPTMHWLFSQPNQPIFGPSAFGQIQQQQGGLVLAGNLQPKANSHQCPHCQEKNISYFVNKQQVRDINELKVYCSNRSKGCTWQGTVSTLSSHIGAESTQPERSMKGVASKKKKKSIPLTAHPQVMASTPISSQQVLASTPMGFQQVMAPTPISSQQVLASTPMGFQQVMAPRSTPISSQQVLASTPMGYQQGQRPTTAPVNFPNQCEYEEISCYKNCRKKIMRKALRSHLQYDCLCRDFHCDYCGEMGTYHTITAECGEFGPCQKHTESHYNNCSEFPVKCPNNCTAAIKRKELEAHRETCPLEPVKCSFSEVGCDVPLVRKDLENHLATSDPHLVLMMKAFQKLNERVSALESRKSLPQSSARRLPRTVTKAAPMCCFDV